MNDDDLIEQLLPPRLLSGTGDLRALGMPDGTSTDRLLLGSTQSSRQAFQGEGRELVKKPKPKKTTAIRVLGSDLARAARLRPHLHGHGQARPRTRPRRQTRRRDRHRDRSARTHRLHGDDRAGRRLGSSPRVEAVVYAATEHARASDNPVQRHPRPSWLPERAWQGPERGEGVWAGPSGTPIMEASR